MQRKPANLQKKSTQYTLDWRLYQLLYYPLYVQNTINNSQNEGLSSHPDLAIPGTDVAVQAQDP
jgi:hypothetical protein